mgnify:CR=1 FL=1
MNDNQKVEERISSLADEFARQVSLLSTDPIFYEAFMKAAIRDFSWSLVAYFPDSQFEIADQLDLMSSVVRDHRSTDD